MLLACTRACVPASQRRVVCRRRALYCRPTSTYVLAASARQSRVKVSAATRRRIALLAVARQRHPMATLFISVFPLRLNGAGRVGRDRREVCGSAVAPVPGSQIDAGAGGARAACRTHAHWLPACMRCHPRRVRASQASMLSLHTHAPHTHSRWVPHYRIVSQKSLPGRQFTGKNPARPGGRRASRIFTGKLSAGGNFWGTIL